MTQDNQSETPQINPGETDPTAAPERKERVLHTRVPAVLERELKQLAANLRLPVSNLVRTILEDAVAAVDSVGERAEGELRGMAERLSRQRDALRRGAHRKPPSGEDTTPRDLPPCPEERPDLLDGVLGYQRLVLASDVPCTVCGRRLPAGSVALRAEFDPPGRKVFLGPDCRLVPPPPPGEGEEE